MRPLELFIRVVGSLCADTVLQPNLNHISFVLLDSRFPMAAELNFQDAEKCANAR